MALLNVFANVNLKGVRKLFFSAPDRLVSTRSKQVFDCVTACGIVHFNCHLLNVISLITCS